MSDSNSSGLSKPQSSSVKVSKNKFAPQGNNPRELREKVKEVSRPFCWPLNTLRVLCISGMQVMSIDVIHLCSVALWDGLTIDY